MQVLVRGSTRCGATRWRAAGWDGDERHGGQWPFRELEGSAHSQDQRVCTCVHVRARRCKTRALVQSLHSHVAMQSRNIRGSRCLLPLCFSSSIPEWSFAPWIDWFWLSNHSRRYTRDRPSPTFPYPIALHCRGGGPRFLCSAESQRTVAASVVREKHAFRRAIARSLNPC